jgi:hypothetical protein
MSATLVRKVMLQIAADDGDTEEKLDKISQKADELAAKHPELKVKIDSAAASAKLAVLRRELKDTGDDSVDAKTRLGALGQALNGLTLGLSGGFGEMTMFQKVIAGLGIATGLGEPLVAGLTVAIGGLSSGLVAAGAGLGVFGLVAKGAFAQVEAADTAGKKLTGGLGELQAGLKSATDEWNGFVTANAGGVAKIMAQGLGLLPRLLSSLQPLLAPVERALSGLVSQLGHGLDSSGFRSFMAMLAANTGPAITRLGQAVGHIGAGLGGIIRAFMPFAQDMLSGLDKITGAFAKWGTTLSGHTGFQSLISTFKSETPQAVGVLKSLAVVIKNVVSGMAGLSTGSNSKMLLQVLGPLSGILAKLSKNQDLVRIGLYLLAAADAGKKLRTAFQGIQAGMGVFKTGASAFQDLRAGFSNSAAAASDATGIWGTFGGKISAAITAVKSWGIWSKIAGAATKVWSGIQAAFNVIMDANPIVLVALAVAGLVAGVVLAYIHFKAFRDIVNDVGRAIKAAFLDALHAVERAVSDVVSWVKGHWQLLLAILLGPIALAALLIKDHWHQIVKDTSKFVSDATGEVRRLGTDVIRFFKNAFDRVTGDVHNWELDILHVFERLPGKIISALSNLGSMLYRAGADAIKGLLDGIKSMIGGALGAVEGWGHDLANALTHPFGIHFSEPSEATQMVKAGRKIPLGLAAGMTAETGAARSAAAAVARAAGLGAAASPAMAGAAGTGRMTVEWVGGQSDQQFLTWIKKNIRIRGGDVSSMGR